MSKESENDLWEHFGLPRNEDLYPRLLLERARFWGVPAGAFNTIPAFDRIYFYHVVPMGLVAKEGVEGTWFQKDSVIAIPEDSKRRIQTMSPRGILLGAGALALEQLRTHAIDLGHYTSILRLSPFRVVVDYVNSREFTVTSSRAQDIIGSEDTARMLKEGKILRKWVERPDFTGYVYETAPGYENDREANFIPKGATPYQATPYQDM
jgi:hypothetical protein